MVLTSIGASTLPLNLHSSAFRNSRTIPLNHCGTTSIGLRFSAPGSCGEQARELFADANKLLDRIISEKLLKARALVGLFAANAESDDVELYTDDSRSNVIAKFHFLRQQQHHLNKGSNVSLSDFIAPKSTGVADYIGAFAVTAGIGADELAKAFEAEALRIEFQIF